MYHEIKTANNTRAVPRDTAKIHSLFNKFSHNLSVLDAFCVINPIIKAGQSILGIDNADSCGDEAAWGYSDPRNILTIKFYSSSFKRKLQD